MKTVFPFLRGLRLEVTVIAFFVLAVLSALVVYTTDPSLYASSLSLTSSIADRYPVLVTLFLVGMIALLICTLLRACKNKVELRGHLKK